MKSKLEGLGVDEELVKKLGELLKSIPMMPRKSPKNKPDESQYELVPNMDKGYLSENNREWLSQLLIRVQNKHYGSYLVEGTKE